MCDETKNLWDIILNIITLLGAGIGFWVGLRQWRRGQQWQRAEQMDKFVQQFESDELLRLAATVIDWTRRTVLFRGEKFTVTNTDALMALRVHTDMHGAPGFEGEQATLRDAYDALLAFFTRLELALTTGLVDAAPAKQYFRYWLEHFLLFDKHQTENRSVEELMTMLQKRPPKGTAVDHEELRQKAERIHHFMQTANPPELVAEYIRAYSDPDTFKSLKTYMDL